ncbi:MAG: aminoacyl-tRNA hydrolase [Aeromicrobium sp.]|nr:aminoacyl-tRNA hydrolase [Aeromicrobium sp.]
MTWLVVGLGNPGPTYSSTRHNVGYMVADVLAARMGGTPLGGSKNLGWKKHKSGRADVVEGRLAGERVVLGRPRSYMNESGGPVSTLAKFFDVEADHLIVIHDELDLDFGRLRVKLGGGDNGHNGLRSIRQSIATGDFYRVRCGIGRPPGRQTVEDYVLKSYSTAERKELPLTVELAADAVESLLSTDLATTQSAFNS